jgi:diguanylate cyclase (GGDEF)-like protein/PAS domain S-box-containing protein
MDHLITDENKKQFKYYKLIESLPSAIYIFKIKDDIPTYEFANSKFLFLYKINEALLINNPLLFLNNISPNNFKSIINNDQSFNWTGKSLINNAQHILKIEGTSEYIDDCNTIRWTIIVTDITNHKLAEEIIEKENWKVNKILNDTNIIAVQGYKTDGIIIYWNNNSTNFYGYTKEEAIGKNIIDLIIPEKSKKIITQQLLTMESTGIPVDSNEIELIKKDGSFIFVNSSYSIIEILNQKSEIFCISTDLTNLKEKEKELIRTQKVGETGTWQVSLDTNIVTGSSEFYRLMGITAVDNLTIKSIEKYIFCEDTDRFKQYWSEVCQGKSIIFETRVSFNHGSTWLRSINEFNKYVNDKPVSVIGTLQNITKEKEAALNIQEVTYKDYLTGFNNRYRFERDIEKMVLDNNTMVSINYIDIDDLHNINVEKNTMIGNEVICTIGSRLKKYCKGVGNIYCIGGDKFALLTNNLSIENLNIVINDIKKLINEPIYIDNDVLHVTASIGTAYTINGKDKFKTSYLFRTAENALYQSKLKGKNKHTCFSVQKYFLDTKHQTKLESIRQALIKNEFELYYQPKINIINNKLISVEALIRWNHPTEGLINPGEFIPYVEGDPVIVDIGDWVIKSATKQQKQWKSLDLDIRVSVNISSIQFEHPMFIEKLKKNNECLNNDNVNLVLEILESGPLLNMYEVEKKFKKIKDLGMRISLDDFGTGHSSLQYLKAVKPDIIKIDKSFVLNIDKDKECQTIVQSILDLGQRFNATVIAEGIETEESKKILIELGCIYGQGYGIGRPMKHDKLITWIKNNNIEYKNK